jgi:putative FmdB family regulatory protein
MPLYEYECDVCAHRFELIQKFSDPPPAACPKCGGAVTKLMSSPAIQFKGSGFYLTDYGRSGGKDSANAKAGKNDSGSSGSGESRSDNKSSDGKSSDSKSSESKSSDSGTTGKSSGDSSPAKPSTAAKSD